jgi:antagonist of KipI
MRTLVVDYGRPTWRSFGVPVGGAADRSALALGNALVGNAADAAALEISLAGPTLVANAPLACVVYGAAFDLACEERTLRAGKSFTLEAGEELRIGGTRENVRGYFCVRGGLEISPVLGSRSSLEPLHGGERLACQSSRTPARWFSHAFLCDSDPRILRTIPGRQANWFSDQHLFGRSFSVSGDSDRMGLRLRGDALVVPDRELVSEPVCPGSVQVTRDGQCIVLGVDGQTIGGYPKIAQVIAADLDKLGRLRPGDEVTFQSVSLEIAESLYRRKQEELRAWILRLQTVSAGF